ncbi:MAG: hypothetical protein N4A49_00525 [Marinifilaceae bacterium]|jgi:hypothetical protein|nr:hypothetical protein [Marinifilaceae bacterium]
MKNSFIFIICFFLFGLLVHSCIESDDFDFDKVSDKIDWTPNMIIPISHGEFTLWDLIQQDESDENIVIDDKGLIHIQHKDDELFKLNNLDDFFTLENQNQNFSFPTGMPNGVTPLNAPQIIDVPPTSFNYSYDDADIKLDLLKFTTRLDVRLLNPFDKQLKLNLKIINSKDASGNEFSTDIIFPAITESTQNIDISELSLAFTSGDQISLDFKFEVMGTGIISTNATQIAFEVAFNNNSLLLVEGYLGQKDIDFNKGDFEMDLDMWDNVDGTFKFADPKIDFYLVSGVGIPVAFNPVLNGYKKDNPTPVPLNAKSLVTDYPKSETEINNGGIKQTLTIDKTTSDIVDLIALPPSEKITYEGSVKLNPNGNVDKDGNPVKNILTNKSKINLGMMLDVPMTLNAHELSLTDTIKDIDVEETEKIIEASLVIISENGLPLTVKINNIKLMSASNQLLSTIETNTILEAAPVFTDGDNKGYVDESKITKFEANIKLSQEQIKSLEDTDYALINAGISTTNSEDPNSFATVTNNTKLKFRIAVQAKMDMNE